MSENPPTVYTSPVPEEPGQRPPRQEAHRRQGGGMKAQLQAMSEKLEAHEEVIRKLGAAFASLAVLQDHARIYHQSGWHHEGRGHNVERGYNAERGYNQERGHNQERGQYAYQNHPDGFSGSGRRGRRGGG